MDPPFQLVYVLCRVQTMDNFFGSNTREGGKNENQNLASLWRLLSTGLLENGKLFLRRSRGEMMQRVWLSALSGALLPLPGIQKTKTKISNRHVRSIRPLPSMILPSHRHAGGSPARPLPPLQSSACRAHGPRPKPSRNPRKRAKKKVWVGWVERGGV